MRIFQVIEGLSNAAIPGSQTWHRNLYEPLLEMGHEVVLLPATEGRLAMQHNDSQRRAVFSQKLLESFRRAHAQKPISIFFAYLMDGMVDPGVIDKIRKCGVPTCNFSCNNTHQFHLVKGLSPHFDFNLHTEKDAREKFLAIGANPLWWPMASNPKYFKPFDLARSIPVTFVGANYGARARYISYLLQHGVDVHAYGPGWLFGARTPFRAFAKHVILLGKACVARGPIAQATSSAKLAEHDYNRRLGTLYRDNLHQPISDDDLIHLYSKSHISLGFLEVYQDHDPSQPVARHMHLRDFEGPMCGALYCTGYMDELTEFFDPNTEIVTYRNENELLEKIRYYLAHPKVAEQIRLAGRRRALAEHTYHARYTRLFSEIGLKNS